MTVLKGTLEQTIKALEENGSMTARAMIPFYRNGLFEKFMETVLESARSMKEIENTTSEEELEIAAAYMQAVAGFLASLASTFVTSFSDMDKPEEGITPLDAFDQMEGLKMFNTMFSQSMMETAKQILLEEINKHANVRE